jgi:hypothetical protein
MSTDEISPYGSGKTKRKADRNEIGNEDPAGMLVEDTNREEQQEEYYEEGNGGATD